MTDKKIVDGKPPKVGDESDSLDAIIEPQAEAEEMPTSSEDLAKRMVEDAKKVIKNFLSTNTNLDRIFSLTFGGQISQFLSDIAYSSLKFHPTKRSGENHTGCNIISLYTPEIFKTLLVNCYDDFILETDVANDNQTLGNIDELIKYFPKLKVLADIVPEENNAFTYLIPMSMNKHLSRAVVTLALDQKVSDARVIVPPKSDVFTFVGDLSPSVDDIYAIAKKYQCKEFKKVLDELKNVQNRYLRTWTQ